jgi:hypothetical protein
MLSIFLIAAFFAGFTYLSYTTMVNQRLWNIYHRLSAEEQIIARIGEMDVVLEKRKWLRHKSSG